MMNYVSGNFIQTLFHFDLTPLAERSIHLHFWKFQNPHLSDYWGGELHLNTINMQQNTFFFFLLYEASPINTHLHVVGMLRFMSVTYSSRACPLLFILFFYLLLSLQPFQLYFFPSILLTTLCFLFFRSYLCLIGPFNHMSLYESLLQLWYNP